MKRRKYSLKEQDDLQRLKRENDQLKKRISSLRKQISRIDVDRYENLQEIVHKFDQQDLQERLADERKEQEKKWKCHKCPDGILKLKLFDRHDGTFYFRKCDCCPNRTILKRWKDGIEGVE